MESPYSQRVVIDPRGTTPYLPKNLVARVNFRQVWERTSDDSTQICDLCKVSPAYVFCHDRSQSESVKRQGVQRYLNPFRAKEVRRICNLPSTPPSSHFERRTQFGPPALHTILAGLDTPPLSALGWTRQPWNLPPSGPEVGYQKIPLATRKHLTT
jgi:hypothetical protein